MNGAASWATVAMGLAGAVIVGGSFATKGVTAMFTTCVVAGVLTLSERDAVNVAVPLNPATRATV